MLLIYSNGSLVPAEVSAEVDALIAELAGNGELIGGQALADPVTARTVRGATVTDGPFVESKEYMAGTLIVECDTIDRATEIALRWPDARYCGLEVRPLMDEAGMEM